MAQIEKRIAITDSIERIFSYVGETIIASEVWPGLIGVDEIQETICGTLTRQLYKVAGVLADHWSEPVGMTVDNKPLAHQPGGYELVMEWV